jgi:HSP20 family protein
MTTENALDLPRTTPTTRSVTVTPRTDVIETDDEFLLYADLPGVAPDGVDVRFENGELTVHGTRTPTSPGKARLAREYEVTNYFRAFRLSDHVAADRIAADLKNGVLTLRLPKAEAVKPRKIAVNG